MGRGGEGVEGQDDVWEKSEPCAGRHGKSSLPSMSVCMIRRNVSEICWRNGGCYKRGGVAGEGRVGARTGIIFMFSDARDDRHWGFVVGT